MLYVFIYAVSLLILFIGIKQKNKFTRKFLIFISLIIPCIFAGARGLSVGTDVNLYVYNIYKIPFSNQYNKLPIFLDIAKKWYGVNEIGYLLLSYFFSFTRLPFNLLLFVIQIFIVFSIYKAIDNVKTKDSDLIFGMMLFYLLFYNLSLNMVRQSLSISFEILSISFLIKEKNKKNINYSILFFILSLSMHKSSLIILPIYLIILLLNDSKIDLKIIRIIELIILTIVLLGVINYNSCLAFLDRHGIFPSALYFLNTYKIFDVNYKGLLINLIILFLPLFNSNNFKNIKEKEIYIFCSLFTLLLSLFGIFIRHADRISYYSFYTIIFLFISKYSVSGIRINKKNFLTTILLSFIFISKFVIEILILNQNETLPYIPFWK